MADDRRFEKIADLIKNRCKADDYVVEYRSDNEALTRFADNKITQNVDTLKDRISLTAYVGGKKATVSTADLSEESIVSLIERCESAAAISVVDREYMPSLAPDGVKAADNEDASVTGMTPDYRAAIAADAIARASREGVKVFGTVYGSVGTTGVYTKNGLYRCYRATGAGYSNTVDLNGEKGSSFSNGTGFAAVDPEGDFNRAHGDAVMLQNRREFEPGRYDVVISAQAATKLFVWLGFFGADRRAVDEGYSPYSGKMGKQLLNSKISIGTDPSFAAAPSVPFDGEGLVIPNRDIFSEGVLKDMPCGRYWADKKGYEPWSARNVIISDGDESDEELLKKVKRGFYIKDFWYIRMVRMEDFTLTGMTRNGFFYVEDGKVVSGANHFRWNDSPLRMLHDLGGLGKGTGSLNKWYSVYAPSLLVRDFYLSSKTLF